MDDMFVRPKKKVPVEVLTQHHVNTGQPAVNPNDPEFLPPEEVAKQEQIIETREKSSQKPPKPPKKASWWRRASIKKRLAVIIPVVILILGGGAAAYILTKKKPAKPVSAATSSEAPKKEEPAKPTTVASALTGLQVEPSLNDRGVTGIMIENSVDARPQSGLLEAGVVYEAIAEGGITRFLTLYQESKPTYIGPVRSARPYYIDWLLPYGATYAHVGGSSEALQMIKDFGIKDMNEFAYGSAFERVSSRYAPHNVYTNMANLDAIRAKNNWGNPKFSGFTRKTDAPSKVQTATAIDVRISSVLFNSHYDYDSGTNSYLRSEGGQAHKDEKSGKQLTPKVVVVIVVPYSIHPDGVHSKYQTVGSGRAFVFQDGIVQETTWSKASQQAVLELKDAGGRTLALNAGQTWITAVGEASMVTYTGPPAPATGASQ